MTTYRIIIVENDEDERLFMKEGFDATGLFEVMTQVTNGDELIEWFEQHPGELPDVILSDLNMPGRNGYDIITYIVESPLYQHIPVIITSTSSTRSTKEKCLTLGAAEYLVKPETFVAYVPYVEELHRMIEKRQLVHRQ